MRYAIITAGLTLAAALQTGGPQPLAPAHAGLRDRVQAYLDEWRSAAAFPGAAVGIVLQDGTAIGIATPAGPV